MLANFERRQYENEIMVWYKKYCDLQNVVHWHNECELIYIKKGTAKIGINKETYTATTGDLLICNSGDMHYINSIKQGTICEILIFSSDYLRPLLPNLHLLPAYVKNEKLIEKDLDMPHLFASISKELQEKNLFVNEMIQTHLMSFFITCLRKLDHNKDRPAQLVHKKNLIESYQDLLEYIDKNYAYITFQQAAKIMNFTPPHFSKIFKEISGMTFTDYLNSVKVEKAITLLQKQNLSVTVTAEMCGFNNIRSFNRVFKKITGTTPTRIGPDYQFSPKFQHKKPSESAFDPTISYKDFENSE